MSKDYSSELESFLQMYFGRQWSYKCQNLGASYIIKIFRDNKLIFETQIETKLIESAFEDDDEDAKDKILSLIRIPGVK